MITDVKTIIFQRGDLMQIFENLPIDEIGVQHFSNMVETMSFTHRNDLVMFIDEDGSMKIFKNRYGQESTFDYINLKNNIQFLIK